MNPTSTHNRIYLKLTTLFGLLLIDQVTKYWAKQLDQTLNIFPGLNFIWVKNFGSAFGLFSQSQTYPTLIIIITLMLITYLCWQIIYTQHTPSQWAYLLILSGAVGNFIDRLSDGFVTDFIDFHWQNHHWYVFNLADTMICTGCLALIFFQYKISHQ